MKEQFMQQTFPAGSIRSIVISNVHDDLIVHGWDQDHIELKSGDHLSSIQQEGHTLMLGDCDDTLELRIPFETSVSAHDIDGDILIEHVWQVAINNANGDTTLRDIHEEVALDSIHGDLTVERATAVHVQGQLGNDGHCNRVGLVEIENIGNDLTLQEVQEARLGSVGDDLRVRGGITSLRSLSIGSDCSIEGGGNAELMLENIGSDLTVSGVARLQASNIGGDCKIQDSANADVSVGNVDGDLTVIGAARVQAGNVSGDSEIRDVQGDTSLGQIGGDASCAGVGGSLQIGNIGGDAQLKGIHNSCNVSNLSGDLHLQADFPAGSASRLRVGGDARIVLPEAANLAIRAQVGGD